MSVASIVLRKVLDRIIEDNHNRDIFLKPLTTVNSANYTSSLISITVKFKHEEELKLFAKIANSNSDLREMMKVKYLFATEQFVYTDLVETYKRIEDKYNLPLEYRFTFPKFYGGDSNDGEEVIVLEDLVDKGYKPYNRFKTIDWVHMASVVEVLAKFHALSFAFANEEPDNFANALEKVKHQMTNNSDPVLKETWMKTMEAAAQVAKKEDKQKITKFLCRELTPEQVYQHITPMSTPVLCHGDFRVCNIMFKEQEDQIKAIVVDYQLVHSGCPVMDLLYLEFMGTDENFRKEYHERLLDHYFTELTLALERFNLDVNDVYSRETFDREFHEMLPKALRIAAFVLPLVLVEADHAPQIENAGVKDFAISPNQQFAERYSGLISDCIRWGVI